MSGRKTPENLSPRQLDKLRAFRAMASDHLKRVGLAIRELREEHFPSKAAFARAAHTDVRTVSRWEAGETAGALTALEQISPLFNSTPDEILARAAEIKQEEDNMDRPPVDLAQLPDPDKRLDRIEEGLALLLENAGLSAPNGDGESEAGAEDQSREESGEDAPREDDEPGQAAGSGD